MSIFGNKDPFSLKNWREFLNQMDFLDKNNISVDSVKALLEEYKKTVEQAGQKAQKSSSAMRKCPECGMTMLLYTVNDDPKKRDRVISEKGEEYKSMWLCGTSCSGKGCLYEEYSVLTVQEEIEKHRKSRR